MLRRLTRDPQKLTSKMFKHVSFSEAHFAWMSTARRRERDFRAKVGESCETSPKKCWPSSKRPEAKSDDVSRDTLVQDFQKTCFFENVHGTQARAPSAGHPPPSAEPKLRTSHAIRSLFFSTLIFGGRKTYQERSRFSKTPHAKRPLS